MSNTSFASAEGKEGTYQTGFMRWRAAGNGFQDWDLHGASRNSIGELEFSRATAIAYADPFAAGAYNNGNYYNGGGFFVGEAISPEIATDFSFKEAIVSWNASTPRGSWLEIRFRAQYGRRWSKWYILGIWASEDSTIWRHSVNSQDDPDGRVADDTFISSNKDETPGKFQVKLRLFSTDGVIAPSVRNISVAYSTTAPRVGSASSGNPDLWNTCLDVLQCSQMVYPNGGNVWCSPTSTAMVLSFWQGYTGDREPLVRAAVNGVYDWVYDGHGNWPFNTAYAATLGYEAYVTRFTSLARLEEFIKAGVPVIMSIAWKEGELTNSHSESSNGHLVVLVGFDVEGDLIINDPDAASDETVRRTYLRSEFEPLWLQASGGTVYLIYPPDMQVPPVP